MSGTPSVVHHTDVMIEEDIHDLMLSYTPVKHDRHQLHVSVNDGNVSVKGYVKGRPAYTFLVEQLPKVKGVKTVDISELYYDENIRIQTGHVIPPGVLVAVEYGAVILSGKLAPGLTVEEVVKRVAQVPGVRRVLTSF